MVTDAPADETADETDETDETDEMHEGRARRRG